MPAIAAKSVAEAGITSPALFVTLSIFSRSAARAAAPVAVHAAATDASVGGEQTTTRLLLLEVLELQASRRRFD